MADAITVFAGSMNFVYLHVAPFVIWMLLLEGRPWPILTLVVSLEAIFLSTFVMISQNRADARRQVLADQQWEFVQTEERQNEELLRLSNQILELTKEIHALAIQMEEPSTPPPSAEREGCDMSRTSEEPVARANGERSSAATLTLHGKRPSSPRRKAQVILLGLWRAAHDFNVAYKMIVSAVVLVLAGIAWKWLDLAVIAVATGLLLMSELFKTAVEQLCDVVQPAYDERIGAVKDVAAAAAGTGMVAWLAVVAIEAVRLIMQLG